MLIELFTEVLVKLPHIHLTIFRTIFHQTAVVMALDDLFGPILDKDGAAGTAGTPWL